MKLFGRKSKDPLAELRKVLGDAEVPSFPRATLQLMQELRDPETSNEEIAESLQRDPGLVVRVLRTVNSAAYGPARPIDDVSHAASYLGRSQLEQIVLALAVKDVLPAEPAPGYDAQRYWLAASFRAVLSRRIAERLHPAKQDLAFTTGILQDMAVPLLATARPTDYGPVLQQWHEDAGERLEELEQQAFGWNHAQVGGCLGQSWELPETLVEGIDRHHGDETTDAQLLPSIRLVAVLRETEAQHGIDALVEEARSGYGLEPDWMRGTIEACDEQAGELAALLR